MDQFGLARWKMETLIAGNPYIRKKELFRVMAAGLFLPPDQIVSDKGKTVSYTHLYGIPGMVTTAIEELAEKSEQPYDVCVAIGPMIMMKFVCMLTKQLNIPTIVSMNPIMVDGTGMCGACRLQVGDEIKFACVDGPEFDGHLVDFDQAMKRQQMYKTEEGRAILKLREGDTHHGGCGNCGGDN